jgi:hypothetical protein
MMFHSFTVKPILYLRILIILLILQTLHSKLSKNIDADSPISSMDSAILYDGSITDFDSRLCGFDIGTCLEVFYHPSQCTCVCVCVCACACVSFIIIAF